ncbi:MAG: MoxR family ATPase [Gaiellales bacterium]|nr:MAG: MoxR family ATPase [Gaiellales bacterium]
MKKNPSAAGLARELDQGPAAPPRISEKDFAGLFENFNRLKQNVGGVIVGKDDVIKLVLVALISGGHVLLEDVPGVGKTTLAKSIARSVSATYARIQFTPDLLPSDITGSTVYSPKREEFYWSPGPLFANIVLADEINRTSPRTQSALLEAMEEHQVTVDRRTHPLPEPFFVIATQNAHEVHGTFPLPEGQMDRFLMSLSIGLPDRVSEQRMLRDQMDSHPLERVEPVVAAGDITALQAAVRQVKVTDPLLGYILDIVNRGRRHAEVSLGPSPRASIALTRASQGLAFTDGRSYVIPDDVQAAAQPVLSHRITPRVKSRTGELAARIVAELVASSRVPV